MFNAKPICEVCGQENATSFSNLGGVENPSRWQFAGDCTIGRELYYIKLADFFRSPGATVDWIAHLAEKNDMDWTDFARMMERFRAATSSFGQLHGG